MIVVYSVHTKLLAIDTVLRNQTQKDTQKLREPHPTTTYVPTDFYLASGTSQQQDPCINNFTINGGESVF